MKEVRTSLANVLPSSFSTNHFTATTAIAAASGSEEGFFPDTPPPDMDGP